MTDERHVRRTDERNRPTVSGDRSKERSEPWHRDAFGRPEQPLDRPPARPHMTVTQKSIRMPDRSSRTERED